ncbi:hypothetical protein [Pseudobdellovibrio exovorus]|uniref:Uncharacterized protein n=1 Tax=Pseudobdellovibrio exovorus JSS TaxID=1184267 RepID=M4V8I9_9BACT|nr:hypothetical protein [Pseudobdellovibrio exovorus]AGH94326.1 hypothetical protein A11Q_106 [Pseudobdellovibrio exovorus JSS]
MLYQKEIQNYIEKHKAFLVKEHVYTDEAKYSRDPQKRFGANGILLLLRLLGRSQDLLEDSIDMIEKKKFISLAVLSRAHLETTASLGYFLNNLKRYYAKEVDFNKVAEVLYKLKFGSKQNDDGLEIDPINVMNMVDAADKVLKGHGLEEKVIRYNYNIACELSHPNYRGISYKTKFIEGEGRTIFLNNEDSFNEKAGTVLCQLHISGGAFLLYYSEAFALLEKHELMPILVK